MHIQKIEQTQNNTGFTGRAYRDAHFWGNQGKRVKNALIQMNQMRVVKNADCDLVITQYHPQMLTVYAQERSRHPKNMFNTYVTTVTHEQSLVSAAKRAIAMFNQTRTKTKNKPVLKIKKGETPKINTENKKPTFFQKIASFGKKILKKFNVIK